MADEIIRTTDVFGISRTVPMNYVTRPAVDEQMVSSLTRNQHLVIFGSSKQGKTSLRKYHLRDTEYIVVTCSNRWDLRQLHSSILKAAGYTIEQSTTRTETGNFKVTAKAGIAAKILGSGASAEAGGETGHGSTDESTFTQLELDLEDVNQVIGALKEIEFRQWIVLEDFHYLPDDTQKDFSIALKAFHESSEITFIVVAVWLQENRLVQFNGDLGGRVFTINADVWTRDEQLQAIHEGERLLNINFPGGFGTDLVDNAFDSIHVVQEVCLSACEQSGVHQKKTEVQQVTLTKTVDDLIGEVVGKQSARYNDFIATLAAGFGSSDLEMYKWLITVVLLAPSATLERGVSYRTIRQLLDEIHPNRPVNAGNVTSSLNNVARLQIQKGLTPIVLDYDQSLRRLNVVDRSFLIWLRHQNPAEILDLAGVPTELQGHAWPS